MRGRMRPKMVDLRLKVDGQKAPRYMRPHTVQVVRTCKQSAHKQSGWAERPELSNRGGWAGAAEAIVAKQFQAARRRRAKF